MQKKVDCLKCKKLEKMMKVHLCYITKALYYHICNDEVNANLYIQTFEKNNIVPKYILDEN
ncbi:MAG: hypothetical protein ACLTMR_01470 [Faecalibacillus sp.]